jgi:hypothetical protein
MILSFSKEFRLFMNFAISCDLRRVSLFRSSPFSARRFHRQLDGPYWNAGIMSRLNSFVSTILRPWSDIHQRGASQSSHSSILHEFEADKFHWITIISFPNLEINPLRSESERNKGKSVDMNNSRMKYCSIMKAARKIADRFPSFVWKNEILAWCHSFAFFGSSRKQPFWIGSCFEETTMILILSFFIWLIYVCLLPPWEAQWQIW